MTNRTDERIISEIVSLRKKGKSVSEISVTLATPKTTVFRYIQSVSILPEYRNEWLEKRGGSKKRKLLAQELADEYAQKIVKSLSKKELLLFTAALYWAEGSKIDFSLSNTDPLLIKIFMKGLVDVLGVKKSDFRVYIRTYEDLDKGKCINYWMKVTDLPREQIKSVNVLFGKKSGKLEYGMCRIRVSRGGAFLKTLRSVNLAVVNSLANQSNIL